MLINLPAPSVRTRGSFAARMALAKAVEKAAAKATMAGPTGVEMATATASWRSFSAVLCPRVH